MYKLQASTKGYTKGNLSHLLAASVLKWKKNLIMYVGLLLSYKAAIYREKQ